jgi:hypothetical protein
VGNFSLVDQDGHQSEEHAAGNLGRARLEQRGRQGFRLYEDTIVVGVQNDAGVLNRETLGRIAERGAAALRT